MPLKKVSVLLAFWIAACSPGGPGPEVQPEAAVWSVDLIKLLPGGEDIYVSNIRDNWAQARDIGLSEGHLLSFRALMAEPDSARGWDIILMTQYVDSTAWVNREEIFQTIFGSAEFERVPPARPSSEIREFAQGGVVMKEIISGTAS